MKKLRRFNPPNLWRESKIEFRENSEGIRIYGFNHRTNKYDKYMGLIKISNININFCFEPNYKYFKWNVAPVYEQDTNVFNNHLKRFWGENAYLAEEAVEYLESLKIMNKLVK